MRLGKAACLMLSSALLLSGCATFHVTPKYFMHPGYAAMAAKVLPQIETGGYTATSVFFHTNDGTRLHGLLLTRPGAQVTVLVCNGANFQLGTAGLREAKDFERVGVNALLYEYRGYGESEGKPTLATFTSDALAAWDFVRSLPQLKGQPMLVYGVSLGSFVAPYVALHRDVAGLVLESTATDVTDWAHSLVPWWEKPFVRIDIAPVLLAYDNRKSLSEYRGPLLLLAGKEDKVTLPRFARILFRISATLAADKMLYVSPDEGHARILRDPEAVRVFDRFIQQDVLGSHRQAMASHPAAAVLRHE